VKEVAFAQRNPTDNEIEALRLVLSSYQDGSGMLQKNDGTLPGWRDFERAVAIVFQGVPPKGREGKDIFDIWLPDPENHERHFGISCKMRGEWTKLQQHQRVSMEISNSHGKFWEALKQKGYTTANYRDYPQEIGKALIGLIHHWHNEQRQYVDIMRSCYLCLMWESSQKTAELARYRLFQFPLRLPDPEYIQWDFPEIQKKEGTVEGKRLRGLDGVRGETIIEWYGESGGQFKFYPLAEDAIWSSNEFRMETLPASATQIRATTYFPQLHTLVPGVFHSHKNE
jgi:hypothetical protein